MRWRGAVTSFSSTADLSEDALIYNCQLSRHVSLPGIAALKVRIQLNGLPSHNSLQCG